MVVTINQSRDDKNDFLRYSSKIEDVVAGNAEGILTDYDSYQLANTGFPLSFAEFDLQIAFKKSSYPNQESNSPLCEESVAVGVWSSKIAATNNKYKLEIVSAVSTVDWFDITLAVAELRRTLERSNEKKDVQNGIKECSPLSRAITCDLIWEANAPLTKLLSPISLYLNSLGGEVLETGLSTEIRSLFSNLFINNIGKRLGQGELTQDKVLAEVSAEILTLCDRNITLGREASFGQTSQSRQRISAYQLPHVLVSAVFAEYTNRRILAMWDPA